MTAVQRTLTLLAVMILTASASASEGRKNQVDCVKKNSLRMCLKCPPNAYLEAGRCYLQDVPGCLEYFPNQNRCKTFIKKVRATRSLESAGKTPCTSLYYLAAGGCEKITEFDLCVRSGGEKNQCDECVDGWFLIINSCHKGKKLNCKKYELDAEKCKVCDDGYDQFLGDCHRHKDHCTEYAKNGDCSKCGNKKFVSNGNCADIADSSCDESEGVFDKCKTCSKNFVLKKDGKCERCNVPNCNSHRKNENYCEDCNEGFTPSNGICKKKVDFCTSWVDDGSSCNGCATNYEVGGQKCVPKVTGCIKYDENGCTGCGEGKIPVNGNKCEVNWDANCDDSEKGKSDCNKCKTGFQKTKLGCRQENENCDTAKTKNKCLVCKKNYYLDDEEVCLPQDQENCEVPVDNKNECQTCKEKFQLENNFCVPGTVIGCKNYFSISKGCRECDSKKYKSDGKGGCRLSVPLCKKHDNDDNPTKCDVCESGYYPKDETTCEPIDDIDICNSSDGKSNVCEVCKAGSYLKTDPQNNKKSCADQHVGGCKNFKQNINECTRCKANDEIVVNNQCEVDLSIDCGYYDADKNVCKKCKSRYYSDAGKCKPIPDSKCLDFDGGIGKCKFCEKGNYPDNKGECKTQDVKDCDIHEENQNKCKWCADGKYLKTDDYTCQTQDAPGCKFHTRNENKCGGCAEKFKKNGNGECMLSVPLCKEHDSKDNPTKCVECEPGYYPKDATTCEPIDDFNICKHSDGKSNDCQTCIDTKYAKANTNEAPNRCVDQDVAGCQKFKPSTNECQFCVKTDEIVFENQCVLDKSIDCLFYDKSTNSCSKCRRGFHDPENGCKKNPENCKVYNGKDKKCETCSADFYLDNNDGKCKDQNVAFCETHEENKNWCQFCDEKHFLNTATGGCEEQKIPGCQYHVRNQNKCESCASHYSNDGDGGCVLKVPHCANYDKNIDPPRCTKCKSGYYPKSPTSCERITDYDLCEESEGLKDECKHCIDTHYIFYNEVIRLNRCLTRSVVDCKKYKPDSNDCSFCGGDNQIVVNNECVNDNSIGCAKHEKVSNVCRECKPGFYDPATLNVVICTPIPIKNCWVYDRHSQTCKTCEDGFYRHDLGSCQVQELENCEVHVPNKNFCSSCAKKYYVDETTGTCKEQKLTGCLRHFANLNRCVTCDEPTYRRLEDKTCVLDVPRCEKYDTNVPTQCAKCESLYYLNPEYSCKRVTAKNCESSLGVINECDKCLPTSYPIIDIDGNKICRDQFVPYCTSYYPYVNKCQIFGMPYIPYKDICVLQVDRCIEYGTKSLLCTACADKFVLDESTNTCVREIPGCRRYADDRKSTCKVCSPLSYPTDNGKKCSPISDNDCEDSSGEDDECSECKPDSCFEDGKPGKRKCGKSKIPGCRFYNPWTNSCSVCHNRYTPVKGRCAEKCQGCQEYDSDTLKCKKCDSTTVSIQGKCLPKIPKCLVHSPKINNCMLCDVGCYPESDKGCSTQRLDNCIGFVRNENYCTKCRNEKSPINGNCPK